MVEGIDYCIDVSSEGSTVWINSADGSCIGRFSKRFGLDVHRTLTEQMAGGSQCLHCTHEPQGRPHGMTSGRRCSCITGSMCLLTWSVGSKENAMLKIPLATLQDVLAVADDRGKHAPRLNLARGKAAQRYIR